MEPRRPPEAREGDEVFYLTPKQAGFILSEARHPAYVGAWGTGKSMSAIMRGMRLSEAYPDNLGVIFRREYTDLRDSTCKDFETYTGVKISSGRDVVLPNHSQILFRHLEEWNNIKNMNLGWFWIEQAEEMETEAEFFRLWGRLRRPVGFRTGFITANTNGHNWIYNQWKLKKLEGGVLYEENALENAYKYLPADTIKSWEQLKINQPATYRQYVLNSWDEADTADALIPWTWLDEATKRVVPQAKHPAILGVDVARFGDDDTVLCPRRTRQQLPIIAVNGYDTMQTSGLVLATSRELGMDTAEIDEIGIGSGVVDRVNEVISEQKIRLSVHGVNLSSPNDPERFADARSEMWWAARDSLDPNNPNAMALQNDEFLLADLASIRYTFDSRGRIKVEKKEETKKRLGRSPDKGDAYVLSVFREYSSTHRPAAAFSTATVGPMRPSWL
jgi:Phage terminase large subunit